MASRWSTRYSANWNCSINGSSKKSLARPCRLWAPCLPMPCSRCPPLRLLCLPVFHSALSDARPQRKQKTLDRDEAAVQEEWDAIPHETPALSSGASAAAGEAAAAAVQPVATISYDDALAALAAADMSAAAPSVVLYEAPASCLGRLLHCFSRPSLHIQNAEEELRLPFLLALTPFDRCRAQRPRVCVGVCFCFCAAL